MRTRSGKGWGHLYRRIALALASARLNGREASVLRVIVYKTIAFNKDQDEIPWSQFEEITGIDQWHLSEPINSLLKKGIIFSKDNEYGVQTDFSKWKTPPKTVVEKNTPPNSGETPPNPGETPPKTVDSRDLSKRAIQEKGLSASQRKKKLEEFKKGLSMMKEEIERSYGKKKEDSE